MINTIVSTTILYWTTAIDLLLILLTLFAMYPTKTKHRQILIGQVMGSTILVMVPMLFAFVFKFIPADWVLGFLGFVPIAFGIRYLFAACEADENARKIAREREDKSLVLTMMIIALSSCLPDNIGLFTPYMTTLSTGRLVIALATFMVNILFLAFASQNLAKIPKIGEVFERFGRWITALVYIILGVLVIVEAGTMSHILNL
ncbi:cadmium resistance transporter [Weissella confusa]